MLEVEAAMEMVSLEIRNHSGNERTLSIRGIHLDSTDRKAIVHF